MTRTIAENFHLHACKIPAQIPGMQVMVTTNLAWVDSGLSCDTFNIIQVLNGRELTPVELQAAIDHFRKKDLAFCLWIDGEQLNDRVERLLSGQGVSKHNMDWGMSLDLARYELVTNALHSQISQVATPADLTHWASAVAANWSPPDQHVPEFYRRASTPVLDAQNGIQLFSFRVKNQVAGTLEMFPSDKETVGLYSLATLAAFRGKGIGSAMMTFALNRAKSLGYRTAVLQASEDGIGIYRKLGFREITPFCEFGLS